MSGGFEILKERGFIKQCTNENLLRKYLDTESVTFYCGFDPTASSLHAGHMIPLFAMAHLQQAGHRAIPLIGGGTARIGDPSGRTETRKILSYEQIKANGEIFKKQIGKFIDFSRGRAVMLDNTEWLADLKYIDFLRDIGRHFSVNRMLSFETYKMRLETGLSFIEFNYQLLQSYDFLVLHQREGCKLQIGGDDQWGNIVAGADLTRRVEGVEVVGLTFPLITRADGKKMGKTEKGAVFLDPDMTPPFEFFQYWRNVPDQDVEKFLLLYTFIPTAEGKELGAQAGQEINKGKERLAYELTKIVHGEAEADKAIEAAHSAFSSDGSGGGAADKEAIPSIEIPLSELEEGIGVLDLFARTSLCGSNSDARRLVQQGGAIVNDKKITDMKSVINAGYLEEGELLLRAGKKRYFRIVSK